MTYGVIVLFLLALGTGAALQFNGEPIDGPFQLYNALRRIAAGQHGGVDFQFFHGLAIPYLHYPFFRLFGGGFTASEVSRQLITTLAGPVVLLAFFRVYVSDWRRGIGWATVVLALTIVLRLWPLVLTVNSLLALRSAAAMLVPTLWMLDVDRRVRGALTGIALAAALLLGTEQGLAVLAAYLIVTAILLLRAREMELLAEAGIALAAMVCGALLFLLAVGGWTGAIGALRYNFKLIPMDQYWYFGVPPNGFIGRWGRLIPSLIAQPALALCLLIGVTATTMVVGPVARGKAERRGSGLAVLGLYGLISCVSLLGIFLISYVEPLVRVALMIGALQLDRWMERRRRDGTGGWKGHLTMRTVAVGACLLIPVTLPGLTKAAAESLWVVIGHLVRGNGMELSGSWQAWMRTGQRIVDANRTADHQVPSIWSTYAGLLEARNGVFHPSTDYIIHPLGPEARKRYLDDFRRTKPVLVQTMLPTRSPYEIWIEQTSWDFYDEVIRNYRVVGNTDWSIFWQRLPAPLEAATTFWAGRPAANQRLEFDAPPSPDSATLLVEVTVHYQARNAMGWLPIVGSMPRYLVLTGGAMTAPPVTLDPYVTTSHFPLAVKAGAHVTLAFETYSLLPGAGITVDSVSAAAYTTARSFRPWLINFSCAGQPESVAECR